MSAMLGKWKLVGVDFHRRWRSHATWLDRFNGCHVLVHHGFYSLEWMRHGAFIWYGSGRHSFWRRVARPAAEQQTGVKP